MQHRIVFYQQPGMTLSKYLTHGGISHSIWVCLDCKLFSLKKKKKKEPLLQIVFFFFTSREKYLSWIPLFSCNSPSSCFHCKRLSAVCLIYLSSVGGTGAPARHSWTRRRVVGGGVQRGRRSLSSPSSGDSRWEVNSANTPGTGRHTPINACFAGERRKSRRREAMSAPRGAACEAVFGVMFIFMYYKTNMDPSKIHARAWHGGE